MHTNRREILEIEIDPRLRPLREMQRILGDACAEAPDVHLLSIIRDDRTEQVLIAIDGDKNVLLGVLERGTIHELLGGNPSQQGDLQTLVDVTPPTSRPHIRKALLALCAVGAFLYVGALMYVAGNASGYAQGTIDGQAQELSR